MVKIHRPDQPLPDAYKPNDINESETDLGEPQCKDVPNYKYGSINLKKYESFKLARSNIELNNQEALAIQQLNQWLSNIHVSLNSMNIQLLVDVVKFLNQYFIYGSQTNRDDSINRVMYKCINYNENDTIILSDYVFYEEFNHLDINTSTGVLRKNFNVFTITK